MDHESVEAAGVFSAAFLKEFFNGNDRLKRRVQAKLHVLAFKHSNSIRTAVARIAEGNGSIDDLQSIAYRLRTTQNKTQAAYHWLQNKSPKIAELFSAHYAMKVDYVASKKMGGVSGDGIRGRLCALVETGKLCPDLAKEVLVQMDEFNDLLEKLK